MKWKEDCFSVKMIQSGFQISYLFLGGQADSLPLSAQALQCWECFCQQAALVFRVSLAAALRWTSNYNIF